MSLTVVFKRLSFLRSYFSNNLRCSEGLEGPHMIRSLNTCQT